MPIDLLEESGWREPVDLFDAIEKRKQEMMNPENGRPPVGEIRQGKEPSLMDKVFRLFENPEKEQAKAVQALVDADLFKIAPSDAYRYRDAIDEGIKLNPQQVMASKRTTAMQRIEQALDIGGKQRELGLLGNQLLMTGDMKYFDEMQKIKMPDQEFIPESKLEGAFLAAAKMFPIMAHTGIESTKAALASGMIVGGAAAAAGPAAPLSVPAGFAAGATAGGLYAGYRESAKIEGGLALASIMNMKDKDGNPIDFEIARVMAFAIGQINGIIEVVQLKTIAKTIPGIRNLFSKAVLETLASKELKDKLLSLAGSYGGKVLSETKQEIYQETSSIVFEELSKKLTNMAKGTNFDQATIDQIVDRYKETAVEAAKGFSVMLAPGTVVSTASTVVQDARVKAASKVTPKPAPGLDGIGRFESGNNYEAEHPKTKARGKYQIMPGNWPSWAQEAGLGEDAEMTPENQEVVAQFKWNQYMGRFDGNDQLAATAWFAGPGAAARLANGDMTVLNRKDANGVTVADYIRRTTGREFGTEATAVSQGPAPVNIEEVIRRAVETDEDINTIIDDAFGSVESDNRVDMALQNQQNAAAEDVSEVERAITLIPGTNEVQSPVEMIPQGVHPVAPGMAREAFAKVKGVTVEERADGTYIKGANGAEAKLTEVDHISANEARVKLTYGREGQGTVAGSYQNGEIRLVRGVGDKVTVAHESIHWLEDIGIITPKDAQVIQAHLQKQATAGTFSPVNDNDIGGSEDRANWIAEQLTSAGTDRALSKILQKVRDFIDAIANAVGFRTAQGVVRDIKTGKVWEKQLIPTAIKDGIEYSVKMNDAVEGLLQIANGADEVSGAIHRPELKQYDGETGITLRWGDTKGGILHIGLKRGVATVIKLMDVIANGPVTKFVEKKKTVHLEKDGYEAILSLDEHGKKKTWLLTGWKIEKPVEGSEVSTQSASTQSSPTFSRAELGAGLQEFIAEDQGSVKGSSTISLYHVGVEMKEGMTMTPDHRGLVWFSTSPDKYGANKKGTPVTQINIPTDKLLIVEDEKGMMTPEGQEVVAATKNGSKEEIFAEAEKRGYEAVQRSYDVSMRPETAQKYIKGEQYSIKDEKDGTIKKNGTDESARKNQQAPSEAGAESPGPVQSRSEKELSDSYNQAEAQATAELKALLAKAEKALASAQKNNKQSAIEKAAEKVKSIKARIREITGQTRRTGEEKTVTEYEALKAALKKAEQASREAYKAGNKAAQVKADEKVKTLKQQIADFVGKRQDEPTVTEYSALKAAFTKAAQAAREAYRSGNKEGIEKAKQEMKAAVQTARDKRQAADKRQSDIDAIMKLSKMKGSIAVDYQKRIRNLMSNFDPKNVTAEKWAQLQSLQEYIDKNGVPLGINPKRLAELKRLTDIPLKSLTDEQLAMLRQQLEQLTELGKLKAKMKYKYNERRRNTILNKILATTVNLDPSVAFDKGQLGHFDKLKVAALSFYLNTLHTPRVADMADGRMDYKGEQAKLVRSMGEGETAAVTNATKRQQGWLDWLKENNIALPEEDSESDIRMMIVIRVREGAMKAAQNLMDKHGIKEVPTLTPEEEAIVGYIRDDMERNKAKLAATWEEINGEIFPEQKVYYLPLKYEGEEEILPEAQTEGRGRTVNTFDGFSHKRRPNVDKIPRAGIARVYHEATMEQEWFTGIQPVIEDIKSVVLTPDYKAEAGQVLYDWWKTQLDIMARRGWMASAQMNAVSKALASFRHNIASATLAFKLPTVIMQPFAVFDAMAFVNGQLGPVAAAKVAGAVAESFLRPGWTKGIIANSAALQQRAAGELAIQEELARLDSSFLDKAKKVGFDLIQWTDLKTAAGVQEQVRKILIENGIDETQAKADAEFAMHMSQGSTSVAYRPHILAQGEAARTWFTFQNFVLNRWGILIHDVVMGKIVHGDDFKARFLGVISLGLLVAGGMAEDEARRKVRQLYSNPKEDKRNIFEQIVVNTLGLVPFFGNFITAASQKYTALPPTASHAQKMFEGAFTMAKGKDAKAKVKGGVKMSESLLTLLFGIPGTGQVYDLVEGVMSDGGNSRNSNARRR